MATNETPAAAKRGKSKTDVATVHAASPYVWDGKDEDERPLTQEKMQAGIEAYRKQRGRPTGSDKESTRNRQRSGSTGMSSQLSVPPAPVGKHA